MGTTLTTTTITTATTEASFISLDMNGDLNIDFSQLPAFAIAKRYALSVTLTNSRDGIANPATYALISGTADVQ